MPIDETGRTDLDAILLTGVMGAELHGPDAVRPAAAEHRDQAGRQRSVPGRHGLRRLLRTAWPCSNADLCGFPNGRRLADDVVDIELRAVAQGYGTFLNGAFGLPNKSPNNLVGDGVDANDVSVLEHVPVRRRTASGLRGAVGPEPSKKVGGDPGRIPSHPGQRERGAERETDETDSRSGGGGSDRRRAPPRRHLPGELRRHAGGAGPRRARDGDGAAAVRLRGRRATAPSQTVASCRPTLQADPGRRRARSASSASPTSSGRARPATRPTTRSRSRSSTRALRLAPHDLVATSGLGSLALSRHRFGEALVLGRKAHAISPTTALNYGITGDALVELGRYDAAFKAFDTMATLKPGLSSYARVSHGLELLGRVPEAIETMKLAVEASEGQGEPEAWTRFQLGKLYWSIGRVGAAERQDRAALRVFPGYHYALDALSRIEAAKGHYRAAIALEQQAVDRIPLPQYVAQLGDLYRVDRPAGSRRASSTR